MTESGLQVSSEIKFHHSEKIAGEEAMKPIMHCCESIDDPFGELVEALWDAGFSVIPKVSTGVIGWTPQDEYAYRMGWTAAVKRMKKEQPG